jgi:hypothetical protein
LYIIIKNIAKNIDVEFGEYFSIDFRVQNFFNEVAKYCNMQALVNIINQYDIMFESEPCSPAHSVTNDNNVQDIIDSLKESGKTDQEAQDYILEKINQISRNIQSICGLFATKAFDLTAGLPQLISQPSAKIITNYVNGIMDIYYRIKQDDTTYYIKTYFVEKSEELVPKKSDWKISFDIINEYDTEEQAQLKKIYGKEYDVAIYSSDKQIFFTKDEAVIYPEQLYLSNKFDISTTDWKQVASNINQSNIVQISLTPQVIEETFSSLRESAFKTFAEKQNMPKSLRADFVGAI